MATKATYEQLEQQVRELEKRVKKLHQAEERLQERNSLLHDVIEGTTDSIFVKDQQSRYVLLNTQTAYGLGKASVEEVIGKSDTELIPIEQARKLQKHDMGIMTSGKSVLREEVVGTTDSPRIYQTMKAPRYDHASNVIGIIGIARDITKQKKIEEALRKSEQQYRLITETSLQGMAQVDAKGHLTFANTAIVELTGYSLAELDGLSLDTLYPPGEAKTISDANVALLQSGKAIVGENTLTRKDGSTIETYFSCAPVFDKSGEYAGFICSVLDISDRKRMEDALKEREFLFSQMFEQSTTNTCLYNPDGTINRVNKEFCKMFGVEEKVIINAGYNVFEDQATINAGVIPLLRDIFDEKKTNTWETIFDIGVASASTGTPTSRTGKIFIKVFGYPVLNRNGNLEYVVLQHYDITERKHLEEQVKQKLIALTQPEVEIGDLSLHDILGVDTLQRLQDAFANAFNMPSIIYGPNGKPFTKPSCFTSFCKLVRSTEKGSANCEAFDGELMHILRKDQTPHIRCGCVLKNMVTGTVPIVIQGQHLANWGFGQRVNRALDLDEVKRYALTIGVDEEALIEAARELKLVDDAAFEGIVNFAKTLSDQIGLLALQNLQQGRAISERMSAEKAFHEAKLFLDNISDLAYRADTKGNVVYANPAAEKLTGFALSEIIGRPFLPFFVQKDRHSLMGIYNRTLAGESLENTLTFTSGITCHFSSLPFKDNHGNIIGTFGIARDMSERLDAEKALGQSEARLKRAQSVANLGNWEYDLSTGKVWGSGQVFRIYDIERTSPYLPLDRVEACISDAPRVHQALVDLIQENKPYDIEFWIQQEVSGQAVLIHSMAELVYKNDMPVKVLGVIQDVTEQHKAEKERKHLEAQLQKALKMEAMGTLAGGIAHDFNNLLMAIQGRASIMLMNKDSSHPDIRHLKGIEGNIESAADLTRQLLGFARSGKYEVRPTDLNELIKKQNRMFGRTKKEITIRGKYEENLLSVEVDRGQIEQVLLNLYVNAWQAMPGGGNLYLETENVTLDENYVKPSSIEPGRYVKTSVTDTGVGMDKGIQEKIFEPFFTTKEMGRGTGLGLASAYGIIKNHGGFINVYSEKGHGTTFNIYLPASEKEIIEEKKPAGDTLRGSETVLFVDDEDMIIEIADEIFEQLGYKVLTARSGKEAIEIYEKNKEQIDIVLLDMIMPDMSGSDTYERMKAIDPDIKVLLSSGYSINGQATEIMERGCSGFIQKPFKMKELSQKLREILDKR